MRTSYLDCLDYIIKALGCQVADCLAGGVPVLAENEHPFENRSGRMKNHTGERVHKSENRWGFPLKGGLSP